MAITEDTIDKRKEIGEMLSGARKAKGLSYRELEALTGVDFSQISKIEKGDVDPQLSSVIVLCIALGVRLTIVPLSSPEGAAVPSPDLPQNPDGHIPGEKG